MSEITLGHQSPLSSDILYPTIPESALEIQDEFTINRPVDLLGISIGVSLVALAALITIAFIFFPIAAAVAITFIGSLALIAGFGFIKLSHNLLLSTDSSFANRNNSFRTNALLRLQNGKVIHGAFTSEYDILKKDTNLKDRKITVIFHGNDGFANQESINYHQESLQAHSIEEEDSTSDYINMNYEGCGTGITPTHETLVRNGISLIESLESMGYQRDNITLFGHSLGGAIAIPVKEYFDQEEQVTPKIKLIAYHTLQNMKAVVNNFVGSDQNNFFLDIFTEAIGWNYEITPERWSKLVNAKVYGGGSGDRSFPGTLCLATNLRHAGITDNVFIRDMDHMDIDLEEINDCEFTS